LISRPAALKDCSRGQPESCLATSFRHEVLEDLQLP
jgi:hypothetical protein